MAAKLTILTHTVAIQLHLVAGSSTICSSRSRRLVRKLLDTPSYYIKRHYQVSSSILGLLSSSSSSSSSSPTLHLRFHVIQLTLKRL